MLTLKEFDALPEGKIFATSVLSNSQEGLFMSNNGGNLRWIAKKGWGYDWVIYCHWENKPVKWIVQHGDKVFSERNIQRCVRCTEEVFKLYRY